MYYTEKTFKKQATFGRNCRPLSRCNNHKTCKTCNLIREKKIKESVSHIQENKIKDFKYKLYLVVKSKDLNTNVYMKNSDIDLFIKDFISKKRNKNFVIDNSSQYFISKEISYNSKFEYNPHANIILLSNKPFNENNKQLKELLSSYNLELFSKKIYKRDNSYKNSILKLISYSIKFDKDRAILESDISLTKGKRDTFKSSFFDKEHNKELQSYLYIYIRVMKTIFNNKKQEIKEHYKAKRTTAKAIFKRNANKSNVKQYIRLLKSFNKKLNFINHAEARQNKRLYNRFRNIF